MVFSDLFFLFAFLPAFMLLYGVGALIDRSLTHDRLHPVHTAKNVVLILFSLLFYAWGEPVYVLLMIVTVALNYIAARVMVAHFRYRRAALIGGLIANIGILGTFKYLGFFAQCLNHVGIPVPIPQIGLPIGISFYIFQSISYLVDVYRNDSPEQKRYTGLLLYISMFPQLIAGPIVRYGTIAREINDRRVSVADISDGVFRFMIGLGKKVILANQFSEIVDQFLGGGLESLSTAGAWIGVVGFTFQIYFDFSGYSDMAIGIGRCIGFHFPENFDHPYTCRTITEFWRRWHMTLGNFFRDYVYIPLGGNRRRQMLNVLIVWFLTGMWHGASWNFIVWGLYFGLIVAIEKFTIIKWQTKIPRPLLHLYALLAIVVGWGIFYFDDMDRLGQFFTSFIGNAAEFSDISVESAIFDHFWLWIAAIIFCMPSRRFIASIPERIFPARGLLVKNLSLVGSIAVSAVLLVVSVALLIGATNNAFLYTRF